jgi:hypothetical protein
LIGFGLQRAATILSQSWRRTELINRLHLQLGDVYTSAYETYFGKPKSPIALSFFGRFYWFSGLGSFCTARVGSRPSTRRCGAPAAHVCDMWMRLPAVSHMMDSEANEGF